MNTLLVVCFWVAMAGDVVTTIRAFVVGGFKENAPGYSSLGKPWVPIVRIALALVGFRLAQIVADNGQLGGAHFILVVGIVSGLFGAIRNAWKMWIRGK